MNSNSDVPFKKGKLTEMKMIKWLAMIGVAGLAVTLLTGCGQGNSYDDEIGDFIRNAADEVEASSSDDSDESTMKFCGFYFGMSLEKAQALAKRKGLKDGEFEFEASPGEGVYDFTFALSAVRRLTNGGDTVEELAQAVANEVGHLKYDFQQERYSRTTIDNKEVYVTSQLLSMTDYPKLRSGRAENISLRFADAKKLADREVEKRYCVIDVSSGPSSSQYPVRYERSIPEQAKTTQIVLRWLPAGRYKMGNERMVTLTKPFYIGVFEVTQAQYTQVMGSNPSRFKGGTRPVERVTYDMIRGSGAGAGWPASSAVDADSFLGRLRARTGLDFDLPTEAQWEYACRAGMTTEYCNGDTENDLKQVGRYNGNGGESSQHAVVGSYQPNAWGLYDMHGNVWEWCLDWYDSLGTDSATDPVGAASGSYRVLRGGSWYGNAQLCRSALRSIGFPSYANYNHGFRLVASPGR